MKICVVIPSFYPAVGFGGPIVSSLSTCIELSKIPRLELNVNTTNFNVGKSKLDVLLNKWIKFENNFYVKYYRVFFKGFSPSLYLKIWSEIRSSDVVHIQGIFNSPTPIALAVSALFARPMILSPRGVLGDWCLEHGSKLKKLWLHIFIKPFALHVTWHATDVMEKEEILALYPEAKVEVISNGVYVEDFGLSQALTKQEYIEKFANSRKGNVGKIIVSMGRLSAKKGFDILIMAFEKVLLKYSDSFLLIAGPDETEREYLIDIISALKLEERVFLIGALEQQDKIDFLANADVFALPSHNENFGNVYVESLASGTPIVASHGTPWQAVESYHCGRWVSNDVDNTANGIVEVLGYDRSLMRDNSRKLAKNFDWHIIASKFNTLFEKKYLDSSTRTES